MNNNELELVSKTAKFLSLDMIDKAQSGHPGIVLSASEIMTALFCCHLKTDSQNPKWFNRDRFVMSAGHGSSLLYSLLHLRGYDFSLEDLKNFRQLESKTPGHPEKNFDLGIDCSTGPLGQGLATAVGMAIGEYSLSKTYNKNDAKIFGSYIYVLCGDGDLQEGITQEALSLLGTLGLNNIIILYDSNDIQLDGRVDIVNTEDVKMKFESMHFYYQLVKDGHDFNSINKAIDNAKNEQNRPSIIEFKTKIGYKTDLEGTEKCHGSPLGEERTSKLKSIYNWEHAKFHVEAKAYAIMEKVNSYFHEEYLKHSNILTTYKKNYHEDFEKLNFIFKQDQKIDFSEFKAYEKNYNAATRVACGEILAKITKENNFLIGGSADVSSSTQVKGSGGIFSKNNPTGRHIMFGVREHAMGAITNGLNLYNNLKSYSGTFFAFSNYMIPAIRMSALMKLPVSYIFSHDTIYVGEDGPTHHPVEHLIQLRSIPGLNVMRPASPNETLICLEIAFNEKENPSVICTTRQPVLEQGVYDFSGVSKGAYIYSKEKGALDGIIVACGVEVNLALQVQKKLEEENKFIRVVSMPSNFLFDKQSKEYQEKIIPRDCEKTIFLEMGSVYAGYKYCKYVYGLNCFGKGGKMQDVVAYFKFTDTDLYNFYSAL